MGDVPKYIKFAVYELESEDNERGHLMVWDTKEARTYELNDFAEVIEALRMIFDKPYKDWR